MRPFESGNYKMSYSGNDKSRRNGGALVLRENITKTVRGYNAKSD